MFLLSLLNLSFLVLCLTYGSLSKHIYYINDFNLDILVFSHIFITYELFCKIIKYKMVGCANPGFIINDARSRLQSNELHLVFCIVSTDNYYCHKYLNSTPVHL